MGAATIVTLVGVALVVVALAAYLTIIAYTLNRVSFTLGTILIGVRAIEERCVPLDGLVKGILGEVDAIDKALSGTVSRATGRSQRARAGR